MKPDFNNSKIYKIVSHQTDKIYIGSTTSRLSKRLTEHKSDYKRYLNGKHHYVTSYEVVKYDDCDIILLESVECNSKDELRARERYWIECSDCVNKCIPNRTDLEYRKDNKNKISEQHKQKFECACNGKYTYVNRQLHNRTINHQKYIREQEFEAYIKTNPSLDDAVKNIDLFH